MSSAPAPNPTSVTASTAPYVPDGANAVVDLFIAKRALLAWLMIVVGTVCFGVGVYSISRIVSATSSLDAEKEKEKPEAGLKESEKDQLAIHRTENILTALGALMLSVVFVGIGLKELMALPKLTEDGRRTDARKTILIFGGLLGLVLMTIALTFFIYWFGTLVKWIDDKVAPPGTYKVVLTILVFLLGAAIAFLSAQPARGEERNDPNIRRLIFGGNLVLSVLLLIQVLVIGNVLISLKVPNKLDTTESGAHTLTLNDATKEYLAGLTMPIKIYSTFAESEAQIVADTRRLFAAMRSQNPKMITVEYLNPTLNRDKITAIRNKYPTADLTDYCILITAGEDEKQYSVILPMDLVETKQDRSAPGGGRFQFVGEAKIIKEMLFLTENKTRPLVYFTTGHGEIEVVTNPAAPARATPKRGGTTLRNALEKAFIDTRTLEFDLTSPKVPNDASIVAIADPRAAFNAAEIDALRKYLNEPQANGKKGKLIVMSSPTPRSDGSGVVDLGLNNLLQEYGVRLGDEYLLSAPTRSLGYTEPEAIVDPNLLDSRNPIAIEFVPTTRTALFKNPREVQRLPQQQGVPYTTELLFATYPASRVTWLENDAPANPGKTLETMLQNPDMIRARRASNRANRTVAAIISEAGAGKIAVYGSGELFVDADRGSPSAETGAEVFTLTVNWLRERPPVWSIANKSYGMYTLGKGADSARLIVLPVLASTLGILALGVGVWMFRRK